MAEATCKSLSKSELVPHGAFVLLLLAGCVSTEIAVPGSDNVRLSRVPGDVVGCTAVGNIKAHIGAEDKNIGDEVKFRNQVIGFGGNVGLVTVEGFHSTPAEGVAYRCPARP